MSGNYLWLLNADSALEFYDRCLRKEAITQKEKNDILFQMCKEGLIECLGHTTMSKAEVAAELAKIGKVLHITNEQKTSQEDSQSNAN